MGIWLYNSRRPSSLIMAWEAPISIEQRARWAIGEIKVESERTFCFRYYSENEILSKNNGRTVGDLLATGFRGYPAFKLTWGTEFSGPLVFNAFSRRIPSHNRPDYVNFVESFRVPSSREASLAELLSITSGRQLGDGFSFVDPLCDLPSEVDIMLEIAGCRHYRDAVSRLVVGDEVHLNAEPESDHDRFALQVVSKNGLVGYVNRLQSKALSGAIHNSTYIGEIVRKNGTPERPRLYAAISLRRNKIAAA